MTAAGKEPGASLSPHRDGSASVEALDERGERLPITVTAPHGTLIPAGELDILPRLTAALIGASGQSGNRFFTPLAGGTVQFLPPGQVYAGGVNRPLVLVELKLPDIGLADPEARAAFIAAVGRRAGAPWTSGTTKIYAERPGDPAPVTYPPPCTSSPVRSRFDGGLEGAREVPDA